MKRDRIWLIGRWLALALLVAQFGAEFHLYSHALADPADGANPAKSCGTCLASSQLQHAVAPPSAVIPVHSIAWVTRLAQDPTPPVHVAPFRAYRSRAPPALV